MAPDPASDSDLRPQWRTDQDRDLLMNRPMTEAEVVRGSLRGPDASANLKRRIGPRLAKRRTYPAWVYRLLVFVIVVSVWQVFGALGGGISIPTFTGAVGGFIELIRLPGTWAALLESNISLVAGYLLALLIGIPTGLALGRARRIEAYADVYISFLLVTPMAALFPLFIIAFGLGRASVIMTVIIFAIVNVIVNSRAGIRQVDPTLIEMARCFGAKESAVWRYILLPGAVPAIMTGVRIALGRAFAGVVIVELLLIPTGIGGLIIYYRGRFQPELLWGTVFIVIIEALLIFSIAQAIEKKMSHWRTVTQ